MHFLYIFIKLSFKSTTVFMRSNRRLSLIIDSVVMATLAKMIPYVVDPTLCEICGSLAGSAFLLQPRFHRVILEGHSLTVVSALHREKLERFWAIDRGY